jgi:hypothetical protein
MEGASTSTRVTYQPARLRSPKRSATTRPIGPWETAPVLGATGSGVLPRHRSRVPLTGSSRKEDFPGGRQALARRPQPRDPQVLRPATPRLFRRRSSSPPVPRFRPATAKPVQPSVGTKTDALGSFRGRLWHSPPWESRFAWAGRPHGRRHPVQVRRLNRASLRSLLARREFAH